jgi:hypothetical protein
MTTRNLSRLRFNPLFIPYFIQSCTIYPFEASYLQQPQRRLLERSARARRGRANGSGQSRAVGGKGNEKRMTREMQSSFSLQSRRKWRERERYVPRYDDNAKGRRCSSWRCLELALRGESELSFSAQTDPESCPTDSTFSLFQF